MPNCIFHIPYEVDLNWPSASQIRPMRMLQAFKSIGYNVDVVMGYGREREKSISLIKDKIKNGIKYDFLYSESSTEPTLLTEKNHIPSFAFLDFNFFKFCKNNGIKIGLFYRDIHWRFDQYKNTVSLPKRLVAYTFYHYDLIKYNKLIDVFYLPSLKMYQYVPINFNGKVEELPPAIEKDKLKYESSSRDKDINKINIFYVGGLNYLYNLNYLFQVVKENEEFKLTVCCREKEWEKAEREYGKYLNDRINIVHESGDGLIPYFQQADILNLFVEPQKYWEFAMPVKLFDYLTYQKPIIAVKGTSSGEFVSKNNVGWTVEYSKDRLKETLFHILQNSYELKEKIDNIKIILDDNTWEARAKKVANDLKG